MLPWLVITIPATIALTVYTSVKFWDISPYQSVYIAGCIFSSYFCSVIFTLIHDLRSKMIKKVEEEEGEGTPREDTKVTQEDTVLVELGNSLPQPEEVISVDHVTIKENNPFLEDVFKVKQMQRTAKQSIVSMDVKSDFTPFKKNNATSMVEGEEGDSEPLAKLRIFLPQNQEGEESDFDFSFNDPAFDSSLCAVTHHGT